MVQGIRLVVHLEVHGRRDAQELFAVGASVGSHGAHHALPEQMSLVVEHRDVAEVNAGDRQGAGVVEGLQRSGHDLAGGSEDDG